MHALSPLSKMIWRQFFEKFLIIPFSRKFRDHCAFLELKWLFFTVKFFISLYVKFRRKSFDGNFSNTASFYVAAPRLPIKHSCTLSLSKKILRQFFEKFLVITFSWQFVFFLMLKYFQISDYDLQTNKILANNVAKT